MPEWILIAIGASQVLSVGLFIAVAISVIRYRRAHQLPESRKTLPFGILRLGLVVPLARRGRDDKDFSPSVRHLILDSENVILP